MVNTLVTAHSVPLTRTSYRHRRENYAKSKRERLSKFKTKTKLLELLV